MLTSEFLKKVSLFEYTDPNRDKLLARVEFNAGDPVVISDAFAPMAGQHGVVLAKGTDGEFQVRFDDRDLSVPEEHLIHSPAPQDVAYPMDKMMVMSRMGSLTEVTVEDPLVSLEKLSESLNSDIILTMPVEITEELRATFEELAESKLTAAQSRQREDIMHAAKNSIDLLQECYGDDWSTVLYSMATVEALRNDALLEAAEEEREEGAEKPFFDHTTDDGDHVTISHEDGKFKVCVKDKHGSCIEEKLIDTLGEAEKLAQSFM